MSRTAIVVGANSAIGRSVIRQLLVRGEVVQVIAVGRQIDAGLQAEFGDRLQFERTDYSDASAAAICAGLESVKGQISHIVICNGILHSDRVTPEKRLEDIATDTLLEVLRINAAVPILWLARLAPLIKGRCACAIAVISARVGSIADNRAGGWYAYRASKAALNMLLKSAAIELQRRAPNARVMAFHPGTTDTGLSRPFQRSVPADKLFTPAFVAERLLALMAVEKTDNSMEFVAWDGEPVPW